VERSRAQLIEAMLRLLRANEPRKISVSELCKLARVSRPTFYQHFAGTDDLLTAAIRQRLEQVLLLAHTPTETGVNVPATVVAFLDELNHDRDIYRSLLGKHSPYGSTRDLMEKWLVVRLGEYFQGASGTGGRAGTELVFVAGGILSILGGWLSQPGTAGREEIDRLGREIWQLAESVLNPGGNAWTYQSDQK
jgi:AcrR family transcriptional regulator